MKPAFCALILTGCTQTSWVERYGDAWCDRYQECEPDSFSQQWAGEEECVAAHRDFEGAPDTADTAIVDCETDPALARACIRRIRRAPCDDFAETNWWDECWAEARNCIFDY